jgi:hypothetical protein
VILLKSQPVTSFLCPGSSLSILFNQSNSQNPHLDLGWMVILPGPHRIVPTYTFCPKRITHFQNHPGLLYVNVYSDFIHNSPNLKQPRGPSLREFITNCDTSTQKNIIQHQKRNKLLIHTAIWIYSHLPSKRSLIQKDSHS